MKKNDELKKCLENSKKCIFDVLFFAKNKDEKPIYAIVKVSPDIKNVVSKNTRLFINMSSHRVTDCYHILQCYRSQSFGHKSSSCPLANTGDSICLYCAGKHISKTCNLKTMPDEHKCSNCLMNTSLDIRK